MENYQSNYNDFQEQEIDLKDYLRIIIHYKWLILLVFIVVLSATVLYTIKSPKIYKTSTRILIEDNKGTDFLFTPQAFGSSSINNTIEVLKSYPVMQMAYEILKKDKNFKSFPINEEEFPIEALLNGIQVESKRDTDILVISYESTSPEEAKAVVNAAAEALRQQNTIYAKIELTNTREFLGEQLDQIKNRLRESEEELRAYKLANGISELSEETRNLIEMSSDADAMLQQAQTEFEIAEQRLSYLKNELSKQDSLLGNVDTVLTSPFLDKLRSEIIELQTMIARLLSKKEYTVEHPQVIELQKELDNSKRKLKEEIKRIVAVKIGASDPLKYRSELIQNIANAQIEWNVAEAKVRSLEEIVKENNKKMILLPDTELELARLQRAFLINEKIHAMLVEKHEDAKIAEQAKMGNVRIIEQARVPINPIKPKKSMNLLIGLVLGLGLGVGLAFVLHSLDTKLRTLDDIENYVKLPISGTIPNIKITESEIEDFNKLIEKADEKEKVNLQKTQHQFTQRLITHYAPKSPVAEAYRTLRTNIISQKKDTESASILITSSGPREGKSTTLSNLAITLAQMESKVIILDLDMRKPMIANIFGLEKERGISDYLMKNDKDIKNFIKKTDITNLDVITSGFIPPNPSEMIASEKLNKLIENLKEIYDYVLIDSPPVVAVTDALILAKKVDFMYLVLRVDVTDRDIVKRTKEMLKNVNAHLNGIIVNGVDVKRYYSGYSYYYYYYYYYYYMDPNEAKKDKRNKYQI